MQADSEVIIGGEPGDKFKLVRAKANEWFIYEFCGRLGKTWDLSEILREDNTDQIRGGRTALLLWLLERVANGSL